jgi:Flp pilus assembly pilin Flp
MFLAILGVFRRSDHGQDLAEYCLLTALVALIALGIFYHVSGGIQEMWSTAGTTLAAGNAATGTNGASGAGDVTASQPAGR